MNQPHEDSPRQRLLNAGPRALTDSELLSLLIQGRSPEESARQRAVGTLRSVGGLVGLQGLDLLHLRAGGVPQTGACTLVAALELACRLVERKVPYKAPMTQPNRVADYLFLRYYKPDQEVLGALFLDGRHHLIGEEILASGSMTRVSIETRTLLGAPPRCTFHLLTSPELWGFATHQTSDLKGRRERHSSPALQTPIFLGRPDAPSGG